MNRRDFLRIVGVGGAAMSCGVGVGSYEPLGAESVLVEDSIIEILPELRAQAARNMMQAMDRAVILGQGSISELRGPL